MENLIEENKLIAEFMGLVVTDSDNYTSELHTNVDIDLKYHLSWAWLMPVAEKCLEKHNNLIDGRDLIDTPYSEVAQALQVVSKKETYQAIVKFIKWYNSEDPSKFLCGICGCECESYVYDADKDADVGECCK
jgi:hypothetical protein